MAHDIYGEKIGIGDQLHETQVEVNFEIKSVCRCCGTETETHHDHFNFGLLATVEDVKSWFENHSVYNSLIDMMERGAAPRPSGGKNSHRGGRA